MNYRSRFISFAVMLSLLAAFVVIAPARPREISREDKSQTLPFDPEELLVYEGEFTRSLLRGVDVADLRFSFSRVPAAGQTDKSKPNICVSRLKLSRKELSASFSDSTFVSALNQRLSLRPSTSSRPPSSTNRANANAPAKPSLTATQTKSFYGA